MNVNLAEGELLQEGRRLVGLTKLEVFGDSQLGSTNREIVLALGLFCSDIKFQRF